MDAAIVNVRYMVEDVEAAVQWYTTHLGFTLLSNQAPAFADVKRGSLRLLLSGPSSSGPGGRWPTVNVRRQADGIASISSSPILPMRYPGCGPRGSDSAMTS